MPDLEEHCRRTRLRYHKEGRDIHKWLDEPSQHYASRHRQFRHDTETVKAVGQLFGSKYGRAVAENIALDHIMADHQEEIKKRHEGATEQQKPQSVHPIERITVAVPAIQRYRSPLMLAGVFLCILLIGSILYFAEARTSSNLPYVTAPDYKSPNPATIGFTVGLGIMSLIFCPLILLSLRNASSLPKYVTYPKYPSIPQSTLNQTPSQNSPWYCSYCNHANEATLTCGNCGAPKEKA